MLVRREKAGNFVSLQLFLWEKPSALLNQVGLNRAFSLHTKLHMYFFVDQGAFRASLTLCG